MDAPIIHHYPQSPVAEKVRKAMGLKGLAWRSVEQSRLPDRPELLAMTGGYRRIPVMQVGADLYCDTLCILREIERRWPEPTLFPSPGGIPFGLARWTDEALFGLAMRVSFAPVAASLPADLVADRTRLYLGPGGDLAREAADLPHVLAQLRPQLGWIEAGLASGGPFLGGRQPGLDDLLAWFIVWFLTGRGPEGDRLLAEVPAIGAWAERMRAIGHGHPAPMSPAEALAVARAAESAPARPSEPGDPQGLAPGMSVGIWPLTDTGERAIMGAIDAVDRDMISLRRHDPACGQVVVHFPRVGYRVTGLPG